MTAFSAIASTGFSKPASSIGQEVVSIVVVVTIALELLSSGAVAS
jgi:hypothetical protein